MPFGGVDCVGAVEEHEAFMQVAIEEAQKAMLMGEVPVGACIVKDDLVISAEHNSMEYEPDPTAHAEIKAIRSAAAKLGTWRLDGCTLYASLEPCSMCAGAAVQARIDKIVFAAPDPKSGACGSVLDVPRDFRLNHFVEVVSRVMEAEASALLVDFFKSRRIDRSQ